MRVRLLASLAFITSLAAPLAAACGGASDNGLFSTPGQGPESGAVTPPAPPAPPAPTGTGTSPGTDAEPPPEDSSPPKDSGPPKDSSPPTDSSPPIDSSRPDTNPPTDAGTGTINCGAALTCPGNQACCGVYQPTLRYQCAASASACPAQSTEITCDSPADCPTSQVCCGTRRQIGGITFYEDVKCAATCGDIRFCDPAVVPSTCRTGENCRGSTVLPGFFTCGT